MLETKSTLNMNIYFVYLIHEPKTSTIHMNIPGSIMHEECMLAVPQSLLTLYKPHEKLTCTFYHPKNLPLTCIFSSPKSAFYLTLSCAYKNDKSDKQPSSIETTKIAFIKCFLGPRHVQLYAQK